jgi:WD40 repeat protein
VLHLALTTDGSRLLSGGEDGKVKVWDTVTGGVLTTYTGHTSYVTAVAVNPIADWAASGDANGAVKIWDTRTGQTLASPPGHIGGVSGLSISPNGANVVTVGQRDPVARIWDVVAGKSEGFTGHAATAIPDTNNQIGYHRAVTYADGGRKLVTIGYDKEKFRVWSAGGTYTKDEGKYSHLLTANADGSVVAVFENWTVYLYRLP